MTSLKGKSGRTRKMLIRPDRNKDGTLTDNGKFFEAATNYKEGLDEAVAH